MYIYTCTCTCRFPTKIVCITLHMYTLLACIGRRVVHVGVSIYITHIDVAGVDIVTLAEALPGV